MNRIGGLLPPREVATGIAAVRRSCLQIVIIVDVAGSASHVGVAECELEACGAVVKGGSVPADGGVAGSTIGRREGWTSGRMRRIRSLLPSAQVAAGIATIGRLDLQIVIVVDVALFAGKVGVAVGKQKTGSAVVEFRAEPAVEIVATLAIGRGKRRAGFRVTRIGGVLPVFQMAGIAARGQAVIDASAGALVTRLTGNSRMSAEERKAILVILDLLIDRMPTLHGVTLGAIGAHLAAVNIGVAIRAILADICKDRLDVALGARNFLVHAAQRIFRLVVIELGNSADGAPTSGGVTVFTRDAQRAVRIPGGLVLGRGIRPSRMRGGV